MTISELGQDLERERVRLGATSCTFYVLDPYWTDEYRLVAMPGVKLREPMHGLVWPDRSRKTFFEGDPAVFRSDARPEQEAAAAAAPLPAGIVAEHRGLFCDFGPREGVKAYARIFHPSQGRPEAILFVNFARPTAFQHDLRNDIQELAARIAQYLPEVAQELRVIDATPLAEVVRILQPAQALAKSSGAPPLAEQFQRILRLSMDALGIGPLDGLGTVHLYDSAGACLRLAGRYGDIGDFERKPVQGVLAGEGVISWVVIRERAILIDDLLTSPFRSIHVPISDEIRSELSVPMIANGEVVGVLNLEAKEKGKFSAASVRSIWCAANSAAVAYQLARGFERTRTLLDVCSRATTGAYSEALDRLSDVLADALSAHFCDIWHYNADACRFDAAGANYGPFEPGIRREGWSTYVQRHGKPVWISQIEDLQEFIVSVWRDGSWLQDSFPPGMPESVNTKLNERSVKAELGLPITVAEQCVGVAWIKYLRDRIPPGGELMNEAFSLADQVGLVLESVQRQLERPVHDQLKMIGEKQKAWSSSEPLRFDTLPFLDGYVVHRSLHAHVCGDFHVVNTINESTAGLLLGDGEGKAVTGLINALPLIACFESFASESGSTRHAMDKLMNVADKLGLVATALYCTFTLILGQVHMSLTSCGHHPLVLVRRRFSGTLLPPEGSAASGKTLGHPFDLPLHEHHVKLEPGDMLILYTDGVSEPLGDDFTARLVHFASDFTLRNSQQVAEAIMSAVEQVTPLGDDATVCVVTVGDPKLIQRAGTASTPRAGDRPGGATA